MKIATHVLYIDFLNVEMFTSTVNFEDTRIKGFNSLKKKKKKNTGNGEDMGRQKRLHIFKISLQDN